MFWKYWIEHKVQRFFETFILAEDKTSLSLSSSIMTVKNMKWSESSDAFQDDGRSYDVRVASAAATSDHHDDVRGRTSAASDLVLQDSVARWQN